MGQQRTIVWSKKICATHPLLKLKSPADWSALDPRPTFRTVAIYLTPQLFDAYNFVKTAASRRGNMDAIVSDYVWYKISGRLCVHSGDTYPVPLAPPAGAVQGLQVSLCHILQDLFLKRQVSHQLLQPSILSLKLLQAFGLVYPEAAMLFPPAVLVLLHRPGFLAGNGNRLALRLKHFNLAQLRHNLLRIQSFPGHLPFPSSLILSYCLVQKKSGQVREIILRKLRKSRVHSDVRSCRKNSIKWLAVLAVSVEFVSAIP